MGEHLRRQSIEIIDSSSSVQHKIIINRKMPSIIESRSDTLRIELLFTIHYVTPFHQRSGRKSQSWEHRDQQDSDRGLNPVDRLPLTEQKL